MAEGATALEELSAQLEEERLKTNPAIVNSILQKVHIHMHILYTSMCIHVCMLYGYVCMYIHVCICMFRMCDDRDQVYVSGTSLIRTPMGQKKCHC